MKDLVATGVPGLDDLLGGGLRRGACVLLEGIPGVGKTTVGTQFVAYGAALDEPGIIVTFEQLPEQIYNDSLNLGWDLRSLEERDRLRVVCTSPEVFLDQLSDVGGMVDSMIDRAASDRTGRRAPYGTTPCADGRPARRPAPGRRTLPHPDRNRCNYRAGRTARRLCAWFPRAP